VAKEASAVIEKTRERAEGLFRGGGFCCSEATAASIRENIAPEMPESLAAAASGFPAGIGGSKRVCGAAPGCLFGRTEPTPRDDPRIQKRLARELRGGFRESRGSLRGRALASGMDMASEERRAKRIALAGEMAAQAARIAARELGPGAEGPA
jgi:C_GCAxxG_C_C family probable redox protein